MEPRIAKCLLLSKVLAADGIVSENERAFLQTAMNKLGVPEEERQGILELNGWEQAEPTLASLPESEKHEIVRQLLEAGGTDGRLSPLEKAMVTRIALALGLDA